MFEPDKNVMQAVEVVIRGLDGIAALNTARRHPILLPDTYGCDFVGKRFWRVWRQQWHMPSECLPCRTMRNGMYAIGNYAGAMEHKCHHEFGAERGQLFVSFFVEKANGDVWKAKGWKAPALNFTRGNVLTGRDAIFDHFLTHNYGW